MAKIRVYTDESVNIAIADGLKRRGVDAFSARDVGNLGLTDLEQLIFANEKRAVIFTHDTDFLRLAAKCIEKKKTHYVGYLFPSEGLYYWGMYSKTEIIDHDPNIRRYD